MITASLAGRRREHGGGLSRQSPDASTAEASPGRVRRGEQGEARRANSTPNGGPHLELGRLRLTTWSKTDVSIAQTTQANISVHLLLIPNIAVDCCTRCLVQVRNQTKAKLTSWVPNRPAFRSTTYLYTPEHLFQNNIKTSAVRSKK